MSLTHKIVGTALGCILLVLMLVITALPALAWADLLLGGLLGTSSMSPLERGALVCALVPLIVVPQWLIVLGGVAYICARNGLWIWRYWPAKTEVSS